MTALVPSSREVQVENLAAAFRRTGAPADDARRAAIDALDLLDRVCRRCQSSLDDDGYCSACGAVTVPGRLT